jgi:aromatic ring hydroxylase
LLATNDFNCTPQFVDPQVDRSGPEAQARSPALNVIETNDKGIIVHGVKAIGTGTAFGDWIHIGVRNVCGIKGNDHEGSEYRMAADYARAQDSARYEEELASSAARI